uniref:Uncharacterized protein n=1 Tax=Nelumbo nucifera TaxID=4432 RepID=A0A822XTD7_NELNU|nr:TPA_asm: hypothetical protein HUJ06_024745 [Nelumbo nucifera]
MSRKQIILDTSAEGSADVTVEGQNPIVINTSDRRKKLCSEDKIRIANGDILELIPGHYVFKYKFLPVQRHISSSETLEKVFIQRKRC